LKKIFFLIALATIVAGLASAAGINLGTFNISPKGTFLEQTSQDNCSWFAAGTCNAGMFAPLILNLNNGSDGSLIPLGVNPGDLLQLTSGGTICYGIVCEAAMVEVVFSSSSTLLSSTNLNRVTGQIPTGQPDAVTSMFFGGSNNVVDDFMVTGQTVTVPVGARYLFVGIDDSFFADNSGTATITLVDTAAAVNPEPGTWALMVGGLGLLAVGARKRTTRS
jgi:hypothetical protein